MAPSAVFIIFPTQSKFPLPTEVSGPAHDALLGGLFWGCQRAKKQDLLK